MKTKYDEILVSKEEYLFFLTLSAVERIEYLFTLYDASSTAITAIDLGKFFSSLQKEMDYEEPEEQLPSLKESDIPLSDRTNRVDVMIDDEIIMIEANSLKALRHVINRFMESGYILQRDIEQERMFRKDKVTKYMRIFYIVDQITGICFN